MGDKIDPRQLEAVLDEFLRKQLGQHIPPRGSLVVAIDGKALRGSIEAGCKRGIYMMAAFLPELGIVIGQVEVANGEVKENEIVAAPKLLLQIEKYVARAVIVAGTRWRVARQCQHQLRVQIREAGGDWVWFVKGNQGDVLDNNIQVLQFENKPLAVAIAPPRYHLGVTLRPPAGWRKRTDG